MPDGQPSYADILVITDDRTHPDFGTQPPAGAPPVELTAGLTLEQLPGRYAERIIEAATPRGENFNPARQFSQIYSFVRRGIVGEITFAFDPDLLIRHTLQLARLLVPNGHSTNYAVRVLEESVFPFKPGDTIAPLHPEDREFAFHPGTGARDWLTHADAQDLGCLLTAWLDARESLPARVGSSMWWAEWTARTPFIQPAYVNTVSALEALVGTNTRGQRAEFVVRTVGLAAALEIDDIDPELMDRVYTARSEITHGAFVRMEKGGREFGDLSRIQGLLRRTLVRAILEPEFAEQFRNPQTVEDTWPVPSGWRAAMGL